MFQQGTPGALISRAIFTNDFEALKATEDFGFDYGFVSPSDRWTLLTMNMLDDTNCVSGEIVDYLLDKGVPLDQADSYGNTALHYATKQGGMDAVKVLIDRGANVNAMNRHGQVPLHHAIAPRDTSKFTIKMIEILVNAGADPDMKIVGRMSPRDLAQSVRDHEGRYIPELPAVR